MTASMSLGPAIFDFHSRPLVWLQTNVNHSSDAITQPN